MKRLLAALLLCALPLAAGVIIKNPYTTDGNWYIGQLHFHTTGSDGTGTPAEMKAAYAAAGYHFVVSTDHRDGDHAGMTADPGGAGPEWYLGEEEYSTEGHVNALGITAHAQDPWVASQAAQVDVDAVRTNGGIAQINHPATGWDWWGEVQPLKRFSLIEIMNGFDDPALNRWPHCIDLADEYRQVWFTGTDDAHNATTNINKWCVVVQTGSGTIAEADVLSSLDSGNFHVRQTATGPTITTVAVSGSTITLTLPSGSYTVNWYKKGKRLVETDSSVTTTASYTVTGTEGYIFAEVYDGTKYAYTQPLFIINDTDLSNAAAASAGTAANLIDNNQATSCDFGATTGNFTIDLGAAKQANGIRIYWNCATTERWNYKIEESTTGAFAGEETEQVRTTFSNRASTTLDVFDCWTRYIKVTITGASVGAVNASVKEVEVFSASPELSEFYLNPTTGSDANNGLTPATAWKTFEPSNSDAGRLNANQLRPRDRLNVVYAGASYTLENKVEYIYGKHAGARIFFHGINWPILSIITVVSDWIDVSGFKLTGSAALGFWNLGGKHTRIHQNKIYSNGTHGVGLSSGSTDVIIAYNAIYLNGGAGISDNMSAGSTVYIYNNVFYGNTDWAVRLGEGGASVQTVKNNIALANIAGGLALLGGTLTDSYNCNSQTYYGTWAKTNNQDVDPQFVNAAAGDFRLRATSPLLRKGVAVGLTTDIAGNTVPAWTSKAPDIGAYENRPGGVFIF